MVDDYELLPHEEIEKLRNEVEHLKKNPYSGSKKNQNLLDSMDELNKSLKKLITIFEGTEENLIEEYKEASPMKVLKEISDQNTKIAEGIISVANMLKPRQQQMRPQQRPVQQQQQPIPAVGFGRPPTNQNQPQPQQQAPPKLGNDLPPLEFKDEKKGMLNKFKK